LRESLRLAGQRFVVGFEGQEASADVKRLIKDYRVGGVILFAGNIDAPEQVAELVRELQGTARDAGHDWPLLISVDQEGGRVARLPQPWTLWPPMRVVGEADSESLARRVGAELAIELRACGILCDYAPVVDVDSNPRNPVIGDRSFGSDPERVGRLGAALIEGLQDGGVAACAKHFPGHGDTDMDSHFELPAVDHALSRLRDVELRPFRASIAAGVASIMTAHVLVRELDDRRPATLSKAILDGLLREELSYTGVVVSDDLEMKALSGRWPASEAAVLAAEAGCDVLLSCRSHDAQVEGVEGIVRALELKRLKWKSAEEAVRRLVDLKERFVLPYRDPNPAAARAAAGAAERVAFAEQIGRGVAT
jgi:beta-N-acetylhexosaminidase